MAIGYLKLPPIVNLKIAKLCRFLMKLGIFVKYVLFSFVIFIYSNSLVTASIANNFATENSSSEVSSDYQNAYNQCSDYSDREAKKECNFAGIYENAYQSCMAAKGYISTENYSEEYYKSYMKAYKQCSSNADNYTKNECNFSWNFRRFFDKCMEDTGLNLSSKQGNDGQNTEQGGERVFKYDF